MPNRTSRKILLFVILTTLPALLVYFLVHSNRTENGIESTAQPTDVALKTDSAPQNKRPRLSESATQKEESRAHTKSELKSFVNSPSATVESVARVLSQADVALLVDMVGDPRYQTDWGRLSTILGRVDEGTEAQHAIIHLIQRGDVWPWRDSAREKFIFIKIGAVARLGQTNGEVAQATARDALTESGALKLAQEWIGRELPGQFDSNPDRVVALIRGRAAMGLVCSLDEGNV